MTFKTTLRTKKQTPNLIICGDYNICHEAIDIHDPVRNKCIWVLPQEDHGLTDL
jgi:exonuclease III